LLLLIIRGGAAAARQAIDPDAATNDLQDAGRAAPEVEKRDGVGDRKDPVPAAAAQRESIREVDSVYKSELAAARTSWEKASVAQKMLDAASNSGRDAAGRFALLAKAREISVEAGDPVVAIAAITQTADAYDIDGWALRVDTVARLMRTVREGQDYLLLEIMATADEAVAAGRYSDAERLASQAVSYAQRSHDPAAQMRATALQKEMREISAAYATQKRALMDQTIPEAERNLISGRFLCLMKGDWKLGLPLLAKGSDQRLKALAAADLRAHDAETRAAAADRWWDFAERERDVARRRVRGRVAALYAEALPSLTDLERVRAESRVRAVVDADAGRRPMDEFVVEAWIDGESELHITRSGIYWRENGAVKPGLQDGLNAPTYVNGKAWMPKWKNPKTNNGNDQSDLLRLPLGKLGFDLQVLAVTRERNADGIDPRDPVTIHSAAAEQIVSIPDTQSGARWYRIKLYRKP